MVIDKKIKRTMWESKPQYLGSLALIIISCLLYTGSNQLASNMANLTSSFEKKYVQEDASFVTDQKLSNIAGLESKFGMSMEEGASFDYPVTADQTLRVFSQNTKVDKPAIIEGKTISGNEVLIDPAYGKANNLKIGETIKIDDRAFTLAGYMSLPNYIYPLKSDTDLLNDPQSFGIAVIGKDNFQAMGRGYSFYAIKFHDDRTSIDSRTAQLKDYLKSNGIVILKWTNIADNPRVAFVTAKIDGINKVSSSMPVAILILTCILTGIVIWRMLKREAVAIGTLYALGYRRREILAHYLKYPLWIAITGGIVGTVLGALTVRLMLEFMVTYFNMPIDAVRFNPEFILLSILLPVVFLTISGYFVINRALKLSPVELMRGGRETGKVGWLERKLRLDRFNFAAKFKIREQLRSIPRSVFLLLGVVLATMLLLYGFAAKSSLDFLVKDTFEETYRYQYEYVFNSLQQGQPSSGEAFSAAPFTLKSDNKTNIQVYGINPASQYISLKDKSGAQLTTGQVIITRPLADQLKVKPGDRIQLVNKLDARGYEVAVDKIAETYIGNYVFMPLPEFNRMLNYPAGSYTGLFSNARLEIPENKLLTTATSEDFKKSFADMTQPLQSVIGTIAFISFVIGLIVIYVVTSLIIEENRQSISLMKVLGYRRKELNSLILNSPSFIIVIGYLIGIPLILASLSAMINSATRSMNLTLPVRIDYSFVLAGFVIVYLTYELSKALSKKKVNRISMTEILKAGSE